MVYLCWIINLAPPFLSLPKIDIVYFMTLNLIKTTPISLLGPNDPPAVHKVNGGGQAPVIIVCDHASDKVPLSLGGLGLSKQEMGRHIAYDIGAAGVAEILSTQLDAPVLFSGFSRLVIDLNRPVDDFTSIREISDGVVVQANRRLSLAEITQRNEELFWPYQKAVGDAIAQKCTGGHLPAIISVHSCTDKMRGHTRPWHIGVLMNKDRRMGDALISTLKLQNPGLCIGDNQPYSGMDPYGYTIETHAMPGGLPNVLLEIRQDLIRDAAGQTEWGQIVSQALKVVLADPHLYKAYTA